MPFIDFQQIKERVSIEKAADYLGLQLKPSQHQLRGPCPACKTGGDRALALTPSKGLFYCFAAEQGGDCIKLVAHIHSIKQQDAAQELFDTFTAPRQPATIPQPQPARGTLEPLDYLEAEHPAVETVGFDLETAKSLGIGYAGKGIMRGTVAVPIRDETGGLLGYIGVTEARLPPKGFLHLNVVPFGKKTA